MFYLCYDVGKIIIMHHKIHLFGFTKQVCFWKKHLHCPNVLHLFALEVKPLLANR